MLLRDNGIETRHLALDSLDEVFDIEPNALHARFLTNAPQLAQRAGLGAIELSGLHPSSIDAVVVSTCTGYLCPGLSGYVIEALGLRSNVQAFDLVGQGCAAALPNMRLSSALLAAGQCNHVLSVCVEVCSAAMYLDEDPGVLISACLFGDGAGAMVLSRRPQEHLRRIEWTHAESLIATEERDALKFEERDGLLRNILTRQVPRLAAHYAEQVLDTALRRMDLSRSDISTWIMHPGGRDVLQAIETQIGLDRQDLRYSAAVLRDYGNLSSASVYFVMKEALRNHSDPGAWWLSSFGAGMSCHGALLKVA
ncbi:type III polyketide synthase [Noviherbaspirillum aerium]|uniref:type III polyketide synthase n=1 Tax=Noviherbaspirillum aerium TaxID=2588497 RepID=UPI001CEF7017|nr:3-oxoacyl-[acyl-carrier-protein] synthase III C-terminal domain-containing protein [Noviherbaspirillum aerium]